MKDSLGRETDHRTPCDDGHHEGQCQDPGCDCNCHAFGWMTQVDQFLHDDPPAAPPETVHWLRWQDGRRNRE